MRRKLYQVLRPFVAGVPLVVTPSRCYWHVVTRSDVPEGETFSRIGSHPTPSEARKVIKEYALSPTFGGRVVACVLTSQLTPDVFWPRKGEIALNIDRVLQLPEGTTTLGVTKLARERTRYCPTSRMTDRSTCEVFFPEEWLLEEHLVFGEELGRALDSAAGVKLNKLGVHGYLPPPSDDIPPFVTCLFGDELSLEEAMEVEARWDARSAHVKEILEEEALQRASQAPTEDDLFDDDLDDE